MSKALVLRNVNFSSVSLDHVTIQGGGGGDDKSCTAITLNQSTITVEKVDDTFQLTATLTPADTTDTLSWASSNDNVASVSDSGLVTVHGVGTVTITATCGNVTATATVTQTSIDAKNAFVSYANHAPSSFTVGDKQILSTNSVSGQKTVGQAYNANDLALHISGDTTVQCYPVPYGATVAKVHTTDDTQVQISYTYLVDMTDLVDFNSTKFPAYVSRTTFVKSNVGLAVSYGQAVVFRPTDEQAAKLAGVYFE